MWCKGSPVLLAYKERIANKTFLSLFEKLCPTLTLGENVPEGAWFELASLAPFIWDSHQAFEFQDGRTMYGMNADAMSPQQWEREGSGFQLRDVYDEKMRSDDRAETLYQSLQEKRALSLATCSWAFKCTGHAEARCETLGAGVSIPSATMAVFPTSTVRDITGMVMVIRTGRRRRRRCRRCRG